MTLGELIKALEAEKAKNPNKVISLGFHHPHSYRGYYECLAFEPKKSARIEDMLACAKGALGQTFSGWKGGDYRMSKYTDVYLANRGCCGEEIGPTFLRLLLAEEEGAAQC